jgi:hypothetical protein
VRDYSNDEFLAKLVPPVGPLNLEIALSHATLIKSHRFRLFAEIRR